MPHLTLISDKKMEEVIQAFVEVAEDMRRGKVDSDQAMELLEGFRTSSLNTAAPKSGFLARCLRFLGFGFQKRHAFDGEDAPKVARGYIVESHEVPYHKSLGALRSDKLHLFIAPKDTLGAERLLQGPELYEIVTRHDNLTAIELDSFLLNPESIPESWKRDERGRLRTVCFWGTIYRDRQGFRYVRCLYWKTWFRFSWWTSSYVRIDGWFNATCAAAIARS